MNSHVIPQVVGVVNPFGGHYDDDPATPDAGLRPEWDSPARVSHAEAVRWLLASFDDLVDRGFRAIHLRCPSGRLQDQDMPFSAWGAMATEKRQRLERELRAWSRANPGVYWEPHLGFKIGWRTMGQRDNEIPDLHEVRHLRTFLDEVLQWKEMGAGGVSHDASAPHPEAFCQVAEFMALIGMVSRYEAVPTPDRLDDPWVREMMGRCAGWQLEDAFLRRWEGKLGMLVEARQVHVGINRVVLSAVDIMRYAELGLGVMVFRTAMGSVAPLIAAYTPVAEGSIAANIGVNPALTGAFAPIWPHTPVSGRAVATGKAVVS